MKTGKFKVTLPSSPRWWSSFPFILALLVLVFIIWAIYLAISDPYDGITSLRPGGIVSILDKNGPTFQCPQGGDQCLQEGDRILFINNVPLNQAQPLYSNTRSGETVTYWVERDGHAIPPIYATLQRPPLEEVLNRLMPILVALVFWAIGVGIYAFKPSDRAADIFFIWCLVISLILATGAVSQQLPAWAAGLFLFLTWLIGPLSVHMHIVFPQPIKSRSLKILLYCLYGVAILGGLPFIIVGTQTLRNLPWYPNLISASEIFLVINMLIVAGLLFYSYRNAKSAGVRGKIRLVVLGGILSIFALTILTTLPNVLYGETIIPYSYALLVLVLIPITYGYAIFRYHLIKIEKHVNRGATYLLVYSILGGFYLILYAFLSSWFPVPFEQSPIINLILVLVLASVFVPLNVRVQKFVDKIFYGGWYDYRYAVTQVTQGMEQITDLTMLANTISERLTGTLHLHDTCIFLRDVEGQFSVIEVSPKEQVQEQPSISFHPLPRSSLSYLLTMGDSVERETLIKTLSEVELTPEEIQLLNTEQAHLWVPVIGHSQVLGLMALGPKIGGDIFSGEDMDILRSVARQVGPVVENIHLLTRLRQHAAQLEQKVKERTAELHDSKERVEAVLASVGDGVFVTDLDNKILTVNKALEEQSGFESSQLVGRNFFGFLDPGNDVQILEELKFALHRGKVWSSELVGLKNGGIPYDIHLTIAPVRDHTGAMVSYVGSQRDITQQKELDRLKDMFVADVSHELRTPTSNICLYLELMDDAPYSKQRDYLQVLKEQSLLLRGLVEDILDLSRLSIGKTKKVEFHAINLNEIAQQAVSAHYPLADASGLKLSFEPEKDLPLVHGERNQLARVVTNLISNAVRYTINGGVVVRTHCNGEKVCLQIEDSGIGIDYEDQPHIFERFYRGQQVRQSKIHGTGLGLAIVKEIVDLHEGNIEVWSERGKGSVFEVWLPIEKNGDLGSRKDFNS